MIPKKRSFFDRLSGAGSSGDFEPFDDEAPSAGVRAVTREMLARPTPASAALPMDEDSAEGQLAVDVFQTASEIVIRAFVAGVRADELSVSISRDMVVLEGSRAAREQISEDDYFNQELFWGSFARKILLPEEIDVENSSASAKDGLLTLILPKLDKARQTKLKVKVA
jgi:HSP20 family molecular chaperone IbpA